MCGKDFLAEVWQKS
ncbi:hypothetical protein YPPY89_2240, partial [Yersinia pestis PY-89]